MLITVFFFSFQCARDGDFYNIKFLLKYMTSKNTLKKNINKHDESDLSPLHYAVRYGHIDSVKLLVEHGAGKSTF